MLFKNNLIKDETSLGLLINWSRFSNLFEMLSKKVSFQAININNWG